ncbi:MAG: hypothetical protein JWQ50_532, partial [Caballeronia mineralivorans]|nr:hypothetical protein [Caballeronia mineralivorans]
HKPTHKPKRKQSPRRLHPATLKAKPT